MRQSSDLISLGIALLDLALISLAFYAAVWWRFGDFDLVERFIWLYYFTAPLLLLLLLRYGVLAGFRYQKLREIFTATVKAFVVVGVVSSTVLYLSKTADYSRLLFGYYFTLSALLILVEKVLVKKAFDRYLRRGGMNIRVAVVGFGIKFEEIIAELRTRPQWGIDPVEIIDPRNSNVDSIVATVRAAVIDEVYVACARDVSYQEQIDDLLLRFENLGLPVRITLNFDELQQYYSQQYCALASKPGVILAPYNLDPDQLIIKRFMDLAGGTVGLTILTLLFPFIALAIKLDSPGPIFYSQLRMGKGGRTFRIYKFRSMSVDAEERKAELLQHNVHSGPIFKMIDDPRVTRVGRVLRKYSLDEFPQFWNVITGDMSLVGARPPTVDEVAEYEDHHFRRISIRPGLTGLWQVSGRNELTEFENVVALDVQYIKKWSIWLDIRIILRTIGVVILPGSSKGL